MNLLTNKVLSIILIIASCFAVSSCSNNEIEIGMSNGARIESISVIGQYMDIIERFDSNSVINIYLEYENEVTSEDIAITISSGASISEGIVAENGDVTGIVFVDNETMTLTITAQDGSTSTTYDITITVAKDPSFISKWTVAAGDTVVLPLYNNGEYDFIVDWGDASTEENITSKEASHQYISAGTYNITIKGVIDGFNFHYNKDPQNPSKEMIVDIIQWGNLKLGNEGYYFRECSNLNITAIDSPDLSNTTKLTGTFMYATLFNSDISNWDVSAVTNMSSMFYEASAFNQDISNWDTSKVEQMGYMFVKSTSFNQDISNWNVSKVWFMVSMFTEATSFNQDLGNWDVSSATFMNGMFKDATAFNQNLSGWCVSNITTSPSEFHSGSKLSDANLPKWGTCPE